MDDKLREAIDKKLGVTQFEQQFVKSFRKVFGISPDIDSIDDNNVVQAHGERWSLDGHNWLLWDDGSDWRIAAPALFEGD